MRTTVANLIKDAVNSGKDTNASNNRWKCRINRDMDAYIVTHHQTDMIIYGGPDHAKGEGWVFALDPGWGSQTDKQGINAMLHAVGSSETYNSLFIYDNPDHPKYGEEVIDKYEEPKPELSKFEPPLRVEDSIL